MESEERSCCQDQSILAERKLRKAAFVKKLSNSLAVPAGPRLLSCDFSAFPMYIRSDSLVPDHIPEAHIGSVRPIQGAYGSVYVCKSQSLGTKFAKKVIKVTSDCLLRSAVWEYETLYRLHHPHIVGVYGFFIDPEAQQTSLLMEYLPGKSLGQLLQEGRVFTGRVYTEREVKRVAGQLLAALCYLDSQGIAHRDINPSNILFTDTHATLIDFQSASFLTPSGLRGTIGTAPYP